MERQEIREEIWKHLQDKVKRNEIIFQRLDFWHHFKDSVVCWEASTKDEQVLFEELHSLVTANILFTGEVGDCNSTEPWYTISEFGEECIRANNTLPFDPDGYIKKLYERIPRIDPVALDYLREAVACYGRNLLLSSTMSLGVASEKCIIVLIDTFADAIADDTDQAKFKKSISKASVYKKYQLFRKELEKRNRDIPPDLLRDFEPMVDGIFNFIRLNRNAAGHPTGTAVDRVTLQANLQIFASYAERVYALIAFLESSKI